MQNIIYNDSFEEKIEKIDEDLARINRELKLLKALEQFKLKRNNEGSSSDTSVENVPNSKNNWQESKEVSSSTEEESTTDEETSIDSCNELSVDDNSYGPWDIPRKNQIKNCIGLIAESIRQDWSDGKWVRKRCEAIEELYGMLDKTCYIDQDECIEDGRWFRDCWSGPYGGDEYMYLDDDLRDEYQDYWEDD